MTTKLFDLTGRIALIAGASRGIGAAVARLLAEQGAHVIVTSRKLDGCQQAATEISAATGRRCLPFAFHAGDWAAFPDRSRRFAIREFAR